MTEDNSGSGYIDAEGMLRQRTGFVADEDGYADDDAIVGGGLLALTVIEADQLKGVDMSGTSDPFVVVTLFDVNGEELTSMKTKVVRKTVRARAAWSGSLLRLLLLLLLMWFALLQLKPVWNFYQVRASATSVLCRRRRHPLLNLLGCRSITSRISRRSRCRLRSSTTTSWARISVLVAVNCSRGRCDRASETTCGCSWRTATGVSTWTARCAD